MESPATSSQGSSRKGVWSFDGIKRKSLSLLRLNEDPDDAQERRLQYMRCYGDLKPQYLPQDLSRSLQINTTTDFHQPFGTCCSSHVKRRSFVNSSNNAEPLFENRRWYPIRCGSLMSFKYDFTPTRTPVLRFLSAPEGAPRLQPIPEGNPGVARSLCSGDFSEEDQLQQVVMGLCGTESEEKTSNVSARSHTMAESPAVEPATESLLQPQSYSIRLGKSPSTTRKRFRLIKSCLPKPMTDHRPLFTYWITTLQIGLFLASLLLYGISPVGQSFKTRFISKVSLPNGTHTEVCWPEPENYFLGPREADLIRLGARYPPCMRHDPKLHEQFVQSQIARDQSSGCCLFTRQSKCYQTQKQYCSGPDTEWLTNPGPNESSFSSTVTVRHNEAPVTDRPTDQSNSRTTRVKLGPVCGLDPKFCLSPRTSPLMPWSIHDVTKWPICEHTKQISTTELEARHMTCEVTARPCCLGLRGGCILTTREHCDFVRGIYNEKAALCSQVNCLEKTCGMLPFANGRYPDQFYRVLTALFIHKGIPQLVVTVAIQLTCMRNLEKFIGWARVMFVYITSGCVGNFLAAYFEPYQVETGPTSSIVALWTFRLIHLLFYTQPVDRFRLVLCKHLTILLGVFLFGLLPWLDNFANLGGLISGVLSSFVLLPYPRLCFSFLPEPIGAGDRLLQDSPVSPVSPSFIHSSSLSCSNMTKSVPRRRIPVELICFAFWLTFVTGLVFLFYFSGVLRCEWCSYFTCVPIALNLCDSFRPYLNPPDICSTQTW